MTVPSSTPPALNNEDTAPEQRTEVEYVLDEQVGFLLRKAQQRHLSLFASHIQPDLTAMQFAALAKLDEVGPCSQNALGRLTAMDVATIKGVVTRLKARGLIEKGPAPDDRRLHLIALTPAGREAVAQALPLARDITQRTLAPLAPEDQATLVDLLRQIT
ncbi:winged helix-turn-helix transcriptional regulator [Roseospira marina]|uniref:Winged helix-turn-helix transcriptional regulator n=1 Tax=Roseospira marina TaxID=140057 RepID=A0A5M6I8V9_9PROT|nr:MarR family winged helix-turn-helix transcriptional regulator [Roseospira marina]KAA5604633.1 winged helix-turn-helix transcriptional regulator [Roseospira marina]MBB4315075.1 DNA-binding MarR family transcriptional regulator [Roseospira marina]MBB5088155.1 DNA-binding MarR family transcriptional regulator [Roseospira marina]